MLYGRIRDSNLGSVKFSFWVVYGRISISSLLVQIATLQYMYPLLQKVKRNDGIRVQYVVENPSIREFFKKVDIMLELMIPTLTIQKYQVLAEL